MAAVSIELGGRLVEVDLDQLTPRARTLAEIVTANPLHTRSPILLESVRTLREMDLSDAERAFYTDEQLDRPHRITWDHWAHYPAGSTLDPGDYLENEARKLPLGYYPTGRSMASRAPSADAARADAELIPKAHVLDLLRRLGRPISPTTMDNYRSRPPADWPQPATYVGRTPMWSRAAIEAYAQRVSSAPTPSG